jgi:hypothetical protein
MLSNHARVAMPDDRLRGAAAVSYRSRVLRSIAARSVLLVTLVTASAQGQTEPPSGLSRELEEARSLLAEQDYTSAMFTLEQAMQRSDDPRGWRMLGSAYAGVGRTRAAIVAFDRFLASPAAGTSEEELARVRAERVEAARRCTRLRLRFSPVGASVMIDGESLAPEIDPRASNDGAREWLLDPRRHRIVVSAQGFTPWRTAIDGTPGSIHNFDFSLGPSNAGGSVVIGGRRIPWWTWVGGGLALAGAGVAIGLAVDRDRAAEQCMATRMCMQPLPGTLADPRTGGIITATAVSITGATLAIAGIILGPSVVPSLASTQDVR